jgi:hypothetical protein
MSRNNYSILPIHKYNNNINTNINYTTFSYYSSFFEPFDINYKYAEINTQKKDKVCLDMFLKDITFTNEVLKNIVSITKSNEIYPFRRFYYINIILDYINNSEHKDLLVITNTFIINQFIDSDLNVDFMPIENEDMRKELYIDFLENLSKKVNRVTFNSLYSKEDDNIYIKKYNNVFIKLNEFSSILYTSLFGLTKLPYLLFTILKSLKCLENNGNLFVIYNLTYVNKSFEWIINLLTYLFDDIQIHVKTNNSYDLQYLFLLICKKFDKEKMTNKLIGMINDILNNKSLLKYNYNCCQFLNYYSSINQKNAKLFDYNFNIYPLDKEFDTPFKPLDILNTIDIDINKYIDNQKNKKQNLQLDNIINILKKSYSYLIELNNYNILKYISKKNSKLVLAKEFIDKIYFTVLIDAVEYFEKYKIPYNKSYLIYINKFNRNFINQIFNYKKPMKYNIIHKRNKSIENIDINYRNLNKNIYKYDIFQNSQELLNISFKVKYDIIDKYMIESSENKNKIDINKITTIIKKFEHGFFDSIPLYINKNLNLKYKIDNIFCEILEIYNLCTNIFPIKQKNTSILLLNELSGQGLYASEMFNIYNNILQQYDEQQRIEWIGIGFNKNHFINQTKYKQNFKNTKTILHKKDIKKINYSINETGDILDSNTQQWYHNNITELVKNESIDLIIADTTSTFYDENIILSQKLEFATLCMILGTSSLNTNCIVKYKINSDINTNNNSSQSSGFLMNCLYVYSLVFNSIKLIKPLNNNNLSYDFYIVCKGFKGINNNMMEKLLIILDNFQENICFINKKDIPHEFVEQIGSFINELLFKNMTNIEITNFLTTCLLNTNTEYFEKAQCGTYFNKKFIDELEEEQIKQWMKDNNL